MRIKICGLTQTQDARLAEELGAYAAGFILVPGTKRYRPPEHVAGIAQSLGPLIVRVGVFQDTPPSTVLQQCQMAGLQAVQLHGNEPPEWAQAVRRHFPVIKAIKLSGPADASWLSYPADALLVDGANPGSGQSYDLNWIEPLRSHPRLMVAGGLRPDNLDPVLALKPYALDVSSGVEKGPGIKDPQKLLDFFLAAAK